MKGINKHMKHTNFRARYGTWALVAGASEGLGAEFATQLAARGLNLVLIARRGKLLEQLGAQLTRDHAIEVRTLPLDLAREDIGNVVEEAISDSEIGLLVYNAALSMIGPYFEIALEDHLKEIAINCRAPLTLSYLLGQYMLKRQRGGIILMSSLSSSQGSPLIANYSATKAYNRLLAEGLWDELRAQGIDVLTCSASAVVTETLAALGKQPVVIPGWTNRVANVIMQRLIPHKTAIILMGRVMRSMYHP
jgi:short-subunit dehydrogenase